MSHSDQSSNDSRSPEGAWVKLSRVAVKGAEYNSRERQPHAKCARDYGTQGNVLGHIYGLLDNTEKSRLIWLHGATGVGKSAVAFTVAERMRGLRMKDQMTSEKRLAGTFFFSREYSKRCTAGYFFATLAYQLACNFPSIRDEVKKAISDNPALLDPDKSLPDQMEALFLQPLRSLQIRLRQCPPVVFVVDALHECISEAEIADLIIHLGQALREPDLPVTHILLTSLSEPHIRNAFQDEEVHPLVCEVPARISAEGHSFEEPTTSSEQLHFAATSHSPSHSLQRASSFQEFERSYSSQLLYPSSHSSDSDQRRRVNSAGDEQRPIVVCAPDHQLGSYHQPRVNSVDDEERPIVIRAAPKHRLHSYHRPRVNSADDEERPIIIVGPPEHRLQSNSSDEEETPTFMDVPPEHRFQSDHRPRINSTDDGEIPTVIDVPPEPRLQFDHRTRVSSADDDERPIVIRVAPERRLRSYHRPRVSSANHEKSPIIVLSPERRLYSDHRPHVNSTDDEDSPIIIVAPNHHQRPHVNSTDDEDSPIIIVAPNHHQRPRPNSAGDKQRPVVILPPQQVQPRQNVVQHNGDLHFQYSTCIGRKKALCVGINYKGQQGELQGCINDAHNTKRFLTSHWGYRQSNVVTLIDDTNNPKQMPTRRNILDAMHWLVKDAHPQDALFFHYSGHGGQSPGENEDEIDELIYPVDYKKAGIIDDNEMHRIMVKSLPVGCRLTAIFDSCHLGTALNLPYMYLSNGRPAHGRISSLVRAHNATGADVISLAACREGQTSADMAQHGMAVGAMSYAFIMSLTRNPEQSYKELLKSVGDILRQKYQQGPQLSSSHTIDTRLRFIL